MLVAAYLVGGFLIASVYAVGMLRGRRDRYHRLGLHHPVHGRGDRHAGADGASATRWPAGSTTTSRPSSPPSSSCRRPRATCPRRCSATSTRTATVERRHPDPGARVVAVGSEHAARTPWSQGRERVPRGRAADHSRRPTPCTWRGTSWSASARCCSCCRSGTASAGCSGATCRRPSGSSASRPCAGVLAVIAMEAGWVVTEVGRQPWIVRNYMKVEDAATGNDGRLDHVPRRRRASTPVVGVTTILVLRGMSRRWRDQGARTERRRDVPYGPRSRSHGRRRRTTDDGAGRMTQRRRRRAVLRRDRVRRVRRRRLRRRLLGPDRRRRRARRATARGHRPLDRPGVGGEPRLADLLPRRAVDGVLRGVRVDHAHALRSADAGRARHRAARVELRLPQGRVPHPRPARTSVPRSPCPRCSCPTAWARWPAAIASGRVPAGGEAGDPVDELGEPDVDPRRRARGRRVRVPRRRRTWCGTPAGCPTTAMVDYFRRRADRRRRRGRGHRLGRHLRAARRRPLRLRRPHVPRASARHRVGACGVGFARAARARRGERGARLLAIGAVASRRGRLGRRPVALHAADVAEGLPTPPHPSATLKAVLIVFGLAAVIILPSLALLYTLDQKSLLADDDTDQLSSAS